MSEQVKKNTILVKLKEGANTKSIFPANVTENFSGQVNIKIERLHSIKPVINKIKTGATSTFTNLNDEEIFKNAYTQMSETEKKLYRTYEVNISDSNHTDFLLTSLRNNTDIEFAELDQPLALYENTNPPNDKRFSELYGLKNIQCPEAWDISQGENVIVAVIDSGVDYNHPDLTINMWKDVTGRYGYDFSGNDDFPKDTHGHGTHVAGIIAAEGNNQRGIIGVAPKAKIMALKIFPNGFDSIAAKALKYAVDNGAKIISNSWGPEVSRPSNPVIEDALDYVYEKGAIAIFAAGNNNDDAQNYSPANYAKVLCVSAVDKDDTRGHFDESGYFSNYGNAVDVAAPGVNILSLNANTNGYMRNSGTSMAAAHVSGLAALILSKRPNLTFEEVKIIIQESSEDRKAHV